MDVLIVGVGKGTCRGTFKFFVYRCLNTICQTTYEVHYQRVVEKVYEVKSD